MKQLFFWTGVVVWFTIGLIVAAICFLVICHWYDHELRPSLGNLRFALFGKPKSEAVSYYELWAGKAKWKYRYFARGRGNKHFARLAMKRLVYEARKEQRQQRRQAVESASDEGL